ncbi:PST family polysaccharide transporter [Xenorhabdus cabanillasii]|uniref:PST family polysaccharide transporter n=1 Tax=Xenorhabdus cabanillasii TaxID=351673 RepID=A0A3D9UCG5_9GAMM|nr:O-antigen translocase [Xenorhabdus cabanillasii]REF25610.1 PST family polysaccharide transporter [Xenorhabdus cabanillasii]
MRALFSVTFWTGLLTIFKMAVGFVITKFVAVYGGPSGLALLGQLQAIVTSFNGIVNAPVSNGIVRYTAENHDAGIDKCTPWWRAGVCCAIFLYLIILIVVLLCSNYLARVFLANEEYAWIIVLAGAFLPFTAIGTFVNSVINGAKDYKKYVIVGMFSTLLSCLIMMVLIYYKKLHGALISVCIQYALVGLISIAFVYRQKWFKLANFFGRINKENVKGIAGYICMAVVSAIVLPTTLLLIRNEMVDQLGWMLTGQWQAVWRISEVYLSVLTLALGVYYLPKLSSIGDSNKILAEVKTTSHLMFGLAIIMAFSVYVMKDFIILILFSPEFLPVREFFTIQLVGDCLKLINWVYSYPMLARGSTRWFISLELFFAFLFFILTTILLHFTNLAVDSVLYSYVIVQLVCFLFLRIALKHIIH